MEETSCDLTHVFRGYCGKDTTMEGKSFAKLAKDCDLLDTKLTNTDVDLIFAMVKDKSKRRICFSQFINGLELVAEKKGVVKDAVLARVAKSKGPKITGTKAEAVPLNDDKSLYTGVYAKCGPKIIDKAKIYDIS